MNKLPYKTTSWYFEELNIAFKRLICSAIGHRYDSNRFDWGNFKILSVLEKEVLLEKTCKTCGDSDKTWIKIQKLKTISELSLIQERIIRMAGLNGWGLFDFQAKNKMLSFKKNDDRINVWYSKMTIGTCLMHPKKGKTQLFRKNVSLELLEKIFTNPRHHTGKGYYSK